MISAPINGPHVLGLIGYRHSNSTSMRGLAGFRYQIIEGKVHKDIQFRSRSCAYLYSYCKYLYFHSYIFGHAEETPWPGVPCDRNKTFHWPPPLSKLTLGTMLDPKQHRSTSTRSSGCPTPRYNLRTRVVLGCRDMPWFWHWGSSCFGSISRLPLALPG